MKELIDRYKDQMEEIVITMERPKDEFRVRNLVTGKFLNKYAGGKSWASLGVAINNAEKAASDSYQTATKLSDFVIEKYTQKRVDQWDAASLSRARSEEKVQKQRSAEERRIKLAQITTQIGNITMIPQLDPVAIRRLIHNGVLSSTVVAQIEPLLVEYYKIK